MGCGGSTAATSASSPQQAPSSPQQAPMSEIVRTASLENEHDKIIESQHKDKVLEAAKFAEEERRRVLEAEKEEDEEARLEYEKQKNVLEEEINHAKEEIVLNEMAVIFAGNQMHNAIEVGNHGKEYQSRQVVYRLKHASATAAMRKAVEKGDDEAKRQAAAVMLQTAARAKSYRERQRALKKKNLRLLQSGAARKMQRCLRIRLAKKRKEECENKIEELEEEKDMRELMKRGSSFSTPVCTPVVKPELRKGFVEKEGQDVKSWKRRFFVLKASSSESMLTYYAKEIAKEPFGSGEKGSIGIKGAEISTDGGQTLLLTSKDRVLKMRFCDFGDMVGWKAAFEDHIAFSNQ